VQTRTRTGYVSVGAGGRSEHSTDGSGGEAGRHAVLPGPIGVTDYPGFFDLEPTNITDATDLYAQPKSYSVVQRDYSAKKHPDLQFDFASLGRFDSTGRKLRTGEDVSRALALGTGLTYFHRPGHPREPPNLFSPFWRATLVAPTIDDSGRFDVSRVFTDIATGIRPNATGDARAHLAAEVVRELQRVGYRGF
jgi:hypothetical protein